MTESRAKGEAARKSNAERRAQWRAEHDRQEAADKTLVAEAMRGILSDQGATARERIFAALTLDHITGNLIPWRAGQLYNGDTDTAAFARAVNAITEAENKGNT